MEGGGDVGELRDRRFGLQFGDGGGGFEGGFAGGDGGADFVFGEEAVVVFGLGAETFLVEADFSRLAIRRRARVFCFGEGGFGKAGFFELGFGGVLEAVFGVFAVAGEGAVEGGGVALHGGGGLGFDFSDGGRGGEGLFVVGDAGADGVFGDDAEVVPGGGGEPFKVKGRRLGAGGGAGVLGFGGGGFIEVLPFFTKGSFGFFELGLGDVLEAVFGVFAVAGEGAVKGGGGAFDGGGGFGVEVGDGGEGFEGSGETLVGPFAALSRETEAVDGLGLQFGGFGVNGVG